MSNPENFLNPIRTLIIDDHSPICAALYQYVESVPNIEVIGKVSSGETALQILETTHIDIVIMDLALPGLSGVQVIREIAKRFSSVRVLILTKFVDDRHVVSAVRAGIAGYLLKAISKEYLVNAIVSIYGGQTILDPQVMAQVALSLPSTARYEEELLNTLSKRELTVLRLLTRALTNTEIASQLSVSENTVRTHISNILTKLGLRDRTQAALFGQKYFTDKLK
jgi:two-component system NarL family response regulator